jgi:hypothetical protein
MAETGHALIRAALAPVRAQPTVRAEQVSQELLGAVLRVSERSGDWARVTGEDGYEGWVQEGGLIFCPAEKAEAWWDDAGGRPAVALDATLADDADRVIARLPWGARVALTGSLVRLPDGRDGRLLEGRLVEWSERARDFPAKAPAVVTTGWEWLGVPYLWGGRTRWGTDCSGFVQAVYRLHGFLLPRDSCQQAEIGGLVDAGPGLEACRPGDLLRKPTVKSCPITSPVARTCSGRWLTGSPGCVAYSDSSRLVGGGGPRAPCSRHFQKAAAHHVVSSRASLGGPRSQCSRPATRYS